MRMPKGEILDMLAGDLRDALQEDDVWIKPVHPDVLHPVEILVPAHGLAYVQRSCDEEKQPAKFKARLKINRSVLSPTVNIVEVIHDKDECAPFLQEWCDGQLHYRSHSPRGDLRRMIDELTVPELATNEKARWWRQVDRSSRTKRFASQLWQKRMRKSSNNTSASVNLPHEHDGVALKMTDRPLSLENIKGLVLKSANRWFKLNDGLEPCPARPTIVFLESYPTITGDADKVCRAAAHAGLILAPIETVSNYAQLAAEVQQISAFG